MRKLTMLGMLAVLLTATCTLAAERRDKATDGWPDQVFAPYVDVTLWPPFDFSATAKRHSIKFYTLAFITANGKTPCWGGYAQYSVRGGEFHEQLKKRITAVRRLGGDVMVSFGGAAGTELAVAIKDVKELTAAYQTTIDAYDLTCVDFDIEGASVADKASIDRRSQAIAALQKDAAAAKKKLTVWFTLPVLPSGLTPHGLYVVQSAVRHGVDVAGVNVMAMDYGDGAAPNPKGRMGDYAIMAGTNVFRQLKRGYGKRKTDAQLWSMVGVTPMIGLNDVTTETFDQSDARKLLVFAQKNRLGMLSIWSLTRDRPHEKGAVNYVGPKFSSIPQQPFEFSNIFKAHGKKGGAHQN